MMMMKKRKQKPIAMKIKWNPGGRMIFMFDQNKEFLKRKKQRTLHKAKKDVQLDELLVVLKSQRNKTVDVGETFGQNIEVAAQSCHEKKVFLEIQVFSCEFCEISNNYSFYRASVMSSSENVVASLRNITNNTSKNKDM